jgi:hypothetical protein
LVAGEVGPSVRFLVQSSPLAGFRYYQGLSLWDRLRVGDELELVREPDNRHDPRAVRVVWRGHMLGYVPKRENAVLSNALDRGDTLSARISGLARHPNPARRMRFDVYLE